jgi:hypothetical protein
MTAPKLPSEVDSSPFHKLSKVCAGYHCMYFWKGEKENIFSLNQLLDANHCFTDRPEAFACLREKQPNDESRHLTEACQGMGASQEKAH